MESENLILVGGDPNNHLYQVMITLTDKGKSIISELNSAQKMTSKERFLRRKIKA